MANRRNDNEKQNNSGSWWTAGAVLAGLGAAAAGAYYLSRGSGAEEPPQRSVPNSESGIYFQCERGRVNSVPDDPEITNLNSLLADIYVRYIAVKREDFRLHYDVFFKIFWTLHQKMKEIDPYYKRYSSMVQFAGSHYDGLRIKKPDEFDMDVVIRAPLSIHYDPFNPEASDINIEPKEAGFVHLNMGKQYEKLPERDGNDWQINKIAYRWKEQGSNYLLRSKFTDWFKSVVVKALNTFGTHNSVPFYEVDDEIYTIQRSESGPAMTLIIKSENFRMDVDLVPALKFPENRWPLTEEYREIPEQCRKDYWMVVPKENKSSPCSVDRARSWRLALHYQERELMHNTHNLRQALRLIKKFRDVQKMDQIASYYIKTIFFWEIVEINDTNFWKKNPATLFKFMIPKFHKAMVDGNIPYFWNKNNNLIQGVKRNVLDLYAQKIQKLISELEMVETFPSLYKNVARYLLTPDEYSEYWNNILKNK